jgi:hypothetical protein
MKFPCHVHESCKTIFCPLAYSSKNQHKTKLPYLASPTTAATCHVWTKTESFLKSFQHSPSFMKRYKDGPVVRILETHCQHTRHTQLIDVTTKFVFIYFDSHRNAHTSFDPMKCSFPFPSNIIAIRKSLPLLRMNKTRG